MPDCKQFKVNEWEGVLFGPGPVALIEFDLLMRRAPRGQLHFHLLLY